MKKEKERKTRFVLDKSIFRTFRFMKKKRKKKDLFRAKVVERSN